MSISTSGFYTVHDGGPRKYSYVFNSDHGFYSGVRTDYVQRDGGWKIERSRKIFETRDFISEFSDFLVFFSKNADRI